MGGGDDLNPNRLFPVGITLYLSDPFRQHRAQPPDRLIAVVAIPLRHLRRDVLAAGQALTPAHGRPSFVCLQFSVAHGGECFGLSFVALDSDLGCPVHPAFLGVATGRPPIYSVRRCGKCLGRFE
jgi:hypothetical protein